MSQLRQELTKILTNDAVAESSLATSSARSLPPSPHTSVRAFRTLLVLVIFAMIAFVALRPILPFGQAHMSAKFAEFADATEDDGKIESHDPLFQPFDD